jgi:Fe-S-cluster-containing dehydrogenase component/CRP-like cAMP-binding protein
MKPGEVLFTPGQPADALFVVASGIVEVTTPRRGDARGSSVRRARTGDAVGEEAVVRSGSARVAAAQCAAPALVVHVPASVYRRVYGRLGEGRLMRDRERALGLAAAREVLLASSLAPVLSQTQLDGVAAQLEHRKLTRGEILFAQGDPMTRGFVIADGMVSLETEREGRVCIQGYLQRGDLVAEAGLVDVHTMTARACGTLWVVTLPEGLLSSVERTRPGVLAATSRIASRGVAQHARATGHVGKDLWRYVVAGSMLVIDDEACVRCGHCAWSCADAHADGASRLVRRGEKISVRDAADGQSRALIVAGSCQQCKHPACMIDCPTGAIGRGASGEVFIREDICVGCGQCERSCPWGGVQMAPRATPSLPSATASLSAQVAVKCDLCADLGGEPACVNACPVEAIARVEPIAAMADVRAETPERAARVPLPRPRSAWPWVVGAGLPAFALGAAGMGHPWALSPLASGAVAGGLVLLLVAYSAMKRVRRLRLLPARVQAIAHLALGLAAGGIVLAHASAHVPPNAAGAAFVAFTIASLTGVMTGLVYAVLPPLLSRIEARARLLEDLPRRARELEERLFSALSGRSEASKVAYARVLGPYARAPLGGLALLASRRTLRAEEAALKARVDAVAEGRTRHLDALNELISLVVERRAVRAQRLLQLGLRACVPAHLVAVAVATVLIAVHVAAALGTR